MRDGKSLWQYSYYFFVAPPHTCSFFFFLCCRILLRSFCCLNFWALRIPFFFFGTITCARECRLFGDFRRPTSLFLVITHGKRSVKSIHCLFGVIRANLGNFGWIEETHQRERPRTKEGRTSANDRAHLML